MRSSHNDILDTLADGQLSDEVIKVIEDTMANVVGQYKG
jgi:F-type H+-transporting ATPase subunit alpha